MPTRESARSLALLVVLALSSAVRADASVAHQLAATKPGDPLHPTVHALGPEDLRRRYQEQMEAAREKMMKQRFQHDGPWEAIAAQVFGVYAKPEPNPIPTPEPPHVTHAPAPIPPAPTSAIHSPVHVQPIAPKVTAVSHTPVLPQTEWYRQHQHSKAAEPSPPLTPAATHSPTLPPPQPAVSQTATVQPAASPAVAPVKPFLSHDTVMKMIKKYTDIITQYRAKRKAEKDKAKRIAAAKAAWEAANPLKYNPPHIAASSTSVHPHPVPPIQHHRFGVATHKQPPPPTHVLQAPTPPKPIKHIPFMLKFNGICVDNATAMALGKQHNPHHHQPPEHYLKHHRNGEPAREIPWCTLKAQSQEIMTRIHPNSGVQMSVSKMIGSVAKFDLFDLSFLSETEFVARGNLSFGSTRHKSHSVAMESAGSARVFKFQPGERAFTAQFLITNGAGGFEGHRGSLTVNGVLQSLNRVEAYVSGVLYPPEDLNARRMTALKRSPFYRPLKPAVPKAAAGDDDSDDGDDDAEDDAEDDRDEQIATKTKPQNPVIHLRI